MRTETDMGWALRLFLGIILLAIVGGAGVLVYASTLKPPRQAVVQVIPNDRFPH